MRKRVIHTGRREKKKSEKSSSTRVHTCEIKIPGRWGNAQRKWKHGMICNIIAQCATYVENMADGKTAPKVSRPRQMCPDTTARRPTHAYRVDDNRQHKATANPTSSERN